MKNADGRGIIMLILVIALFVVVVLFMMTQRGGHGSLFAGYAERVTSAAPTATH